MAMEPIQGSLDLPRKVSVVGARWPEDDDDDRALRHFRKYVKVGPYSLSREMCDVLSLEGCSRIWWPPR